MGGSGVLRTRSTVRNAGKFVVLRSPATSWIASEPPPTKHPPSTHHPPPTHPPTDQSTITAVQQQWSSTYRPIHNCSTAVRQYAPQRYTCGTPGPGWDFFHFLTIVHLPGESASRPRRGFSRPPLAELGLVGRCVRGDTEGCCVGRAWHDRAVAISGVFRMTNRHGHWIM